MLFCGCRYRIVYYVCLHEKWEMRCAPLLLGFWSWGVSQRCDCIDRRSEFTYWVYDIATTEEQNLFTFTGFGLPSHVVLYHKRLILLIE